LIQEKAKELKADLICLSEVYSHSRGKKHQGLIFKNTYFKNWYYYFDRTSEVSMLSKFPGLTVHRTSCGIIVRFPQFYCVVLHLNDFPYQPFQATFQPYCLSHCQPFIRTPTQLKKAAKEARFQDFLHLLNPILHSWIPVVMVGDFNEPSHLDWNSTNTRTKKCPFPVAFPISSFLNRHDFTDTYKWKHPRKWNTTWPSKKKKERADRIDFIYCRNEEDIVDADIDSVHSPSDHAFIHATINFY